MALQELSSPPPVSGYAQLGQVIANAGERYASNARQDQLIAQARANQLADVQGARDYADARWSDERMARLTDDHKLSMQRIRDAMVADAERAGLLKVEDADDPAKVGPAIEEMNRRGMLERYKPLLQSGALKVADVGNPLALDTAMQSEADISAAQLRAERDAKARSLLGGQATADRALANENDVKQQISDLTQELNRSVPQPSQGEILNRAGELYLQNHPGEKAVPTDTGKIAMEIQQAQKDLQTQRYLTAKERHDQIQQQILILRQQLIEQGRTSAELGRQGLFANPNAAPVSNPNSLLNLSRPAEQVAPASAPSDFLSRMRAGNNPAAGESIDGPASVNDLPVGASDQDLAIQQAGAAAARKVAQTSAQSTLVQETQKMQQIQQQLARVRAGQPAEGPVGGGHDEFGVRAPLYDSLDPQQQAAENTRLLQAAAAQGAKIKSLIAQLQGPTPTKTMSPAVNTATFSTPAAAFATPSSLVSTNTAWWKTQPTAPAGM